MRIKSLLLFCILGVSGVSFADESARGFVLGAACLNCHALESSSIKGIPSLKAHTRASIVEALTAFKNGSRDATIMNRLARGYSAEEISSIAAWLKAR